MMYLPRFLTMLAVLATLLGCQAPAPLPTPTTPAIAHVPKPAHPLSPYTDEVDNSPLARYLRGEPLNDPPPKAEPTRAMCVQSGAFNIASDGQSLLMETYCVTNIAGGKEGQQVDDTVAPRIDGSKFRISFDRATVSVRQLPGGKREVRLHYHDRNSGSNSREIVLTLPERPGEQYKYSFEDLSPLKIRPIGEVRMLGPDSQSSAPRAGASACTPNGLFTYMNGSVTLIKACIRMFSEGSEAFWYETQSVPLRAGRYALPFRDTYLVPQNQAAFAFHATQRNGQLVDRLLRPDAEGIYSFEDVRDNLEELP